LWLFFILNKFLQNSRLVLIGCWFWWGGWAAGGILTSEAKLKLGGITL
jgi:hypothetical protein